MQLCTFKTITVVMSFLLGVFVYLFTKSKKFECPAQCGIYLWYFVFLKSTAGSYSMFEGNNLQ